MENNNCENGHTTEKWIVELKIKHLKKAIDNIGKPCMQKIYIASNDIGMSGAMGSGEYIDLSEETFVYKGLKIALMNMLEVQEDILKNINHGKR